VTSLYLVRYLAHMTTHVHERGSIPAFTVADRLRKAREVARLEQCDLAAAIDVSRGTVSNYERGSVQPRVIVMKAWALRTGVPLSWIQTGDGNEGEAPRPDGPDGGLQGDVRREGIEPPTR